MSASTAQRAGSALFWKGLQHAGVKAIFFLRLLVLARLLTPDDFGLLAISMVALGILSQVTDFGLVPALVQRADVNEPHYHSAWTLGVLRAMAISAVVFLGAPLIAWAFEEPRAELIIRVLALRPLLEAFASIKVVDLNRALRFRALAFLRLPEALASTVIAIALAPSLGVWALVAGSLAGPAVVLVLSYFLAPYRPRFLLDRPAAASLIQFGRWIFTVSIISVLGTALLRLVIARQLGTVELGLYYLGASLAFLPSDIASQVVGDVTFPLYSRLQANLAKMRRVFQSVFTGLLALLLPLCALLIALAPGLVTHILGPKWEGTVPVIRILALVNIVGLLGDTVVPLLKGIGQPSKVAAATGSQTAVLVAVMWFFTGYWGVGGAALAWLPAIAVSQVIIIKYLYDLLPHPFAGLLKPAGIVVLVSLSGAAIAMKIYEMLPNLFGLIGAAAASTAFIGGMLWIFERRLSLGLLDDLAQVFPRLANRIGYHPGKL